MLRAIGKGIFGLPIGVLLVWSLFPLWYAVVALLCRHTPQDQPWATLMAACVVLTLPVAGLVLLFQRRIVVMLG